MSESSQSDLPYIIPTKGKGPLAKGTSYFCGAQLLSERFSSVPQIKLLSVSFYGEKSVAFLNEDRGGGTMTLRYKKRHPGIHAPRDSTEEGRSWYSPQWEINIYPIVSTAKAHLRNYLETEGWALMVGWFHSKWPLHGREGKASFDLYMKSSGEIHHTETESVLPSI